MIFSAWHPLTLPLVWMGLLSQQFVTSILDVVYDRIQHLFGSIHLQDLFLRCVAMLEISLQEIV